MLPRIGRIYSFLYPACNEVGVPVETRLRRVLVRSIRDLRKEPLTVADIVRRPMVRRGSILVEALDLEANETRHFYWDWATARELVLITPTGKRALRSGPSRYERLMFAELCARVSAPEAVSIRPAA